MMKPIAPHNDLMQLQITNGKKVTELMARHMDEGLEGLYEVWKGLDGKLATGWRVELWNWTAERLATKEEKQFVRDAVAYGDSYAWELYCPTTGLAYEECACLDGTKCEHAETENPEFYSVESLKFRAENEDDYFSEKAVAIAKKLLKV